MRRAIGFSASVILVLYLACGTGLRAQQSRGSFTGTVTDTSGGVIPAVVVTATEVDTGISQNSVTQEDGSYTIPLLPPGRYQLSAQKAGFEKTTQGIIVLAVDAHPRIDFQLQVGSQATTVEVQSSAPVLDTQTYSVGTTVEQAKVSELPFNGRQFLQATLFTPGVVPGSQGSELNDNRGGSINVNGMRESMNDFLLDGMSDTSIAVGTYSASPPLDSIAEFRMETGVYDAKFGTTGGAQVNMVTKSGTNQLHGSLYEYLRNNDLDARNFFEPFVPPFHRNQFGVSLGGPIVLPHVYDGHDKSFFFINYEGLQDRLTSFSRAHVPTVAERGGDFSDLQAADCSTQTVLLDPLILFPSSTPPPLTVPGNNVNNLAPAFPSGTLDPVGQAMVNRYPQPNLAAGCGGENFTAPVLTIINTNSYVGRFDHRFGSKDSIFYRYNLTTDSELSPSGLPTGVPGYGLRRLDWFTATGLDWVHTFSPTIINEAKVDYNRWQYGWTAEDQGDLVNQQLGIQGAPTALRDTGSPNISFSPYDGMGSFTSAPQAGAVNTFEYADTITQIHGNHSLAYGVQIRSIKRGNFYEDIDARDDYGFNGVVTGALVEAGLEQSLPSSVVQQLLGQACPSGNCTFGNGAADAMFGLPTSWIRGFSGYISGAGSENDFFAQDTWKARRDLTVTFGLRYEYNTPITDKANHLAGFDFNKGQLLVAGTTLATLESFVGTAPANTASGYPVGNFVVSGHETLGSIGANRSLQHSDPHDFGPRLGFAWQPFNSKKTVLRGGYGIYYDQMTGELYFQKSFNPPFFQASSGNLQDNEQPVLEALSQGSLPLGSGLFLQDLFTSPALAPTLFPTLNPVIINLHDSTIQQWSLDVQRELPGSWLLDVGYVGTHGVHLPFMWDPNQPDNSNPAACINNGGACPRTYTDYLTMSYTDSAGKSSYNSLQVKAEKHYSKGMAVIGAYTYGKSLDTNSTYYGTNGTANFPENSFDRAAEKGRSDFDYRQRFSLAYVYDLPIGSTMWKSSNRAVNYAIQGWEVAGIAMVQSGAPFTPTVDGNPSHNVDGNDRPNVVAGVPFYPAHQTVQQWANPAAFSTPAQYTYGNAGRDILNGPGEAAWDFSLIRNFKLGESKKLEFRAEMFNILNTANFTLPNGDVSSPSFGVIGSTVQSIAGQASGGPGDPREIQFALRLAW